NFPNIPAEIYEKSYLFLGGSTLLNAVGDHFEGDLSGISQKNIPAWFSKFHKPGIEISKLKNWTQKLEEITLNAKDWDVAFIAGVPSWIQLLIERIIKHYGVNNIHDIWPNLTVFAWGGVSFEPYKKGFERLLGKPILYLETYLASEGFLAYQVRPEGNLQLVLNDGIFFEFVPFTKENFDEEGVLKSDVEAFKIDQVVQNKEYALLITTCSGAWRYLIGDTVKFTDVELAEIVITGRTKQFLSLCGEHLSIDNMNKAIELAAQKFNISINEFTVTGTKDPPFFGHQWYVGADEPIDEKALGEFIDETLRKINDDYSVERDHVLTKVSLKIIPSDFFLKWLQTQLELGSQTKFPRVLKGHRQNSWEAFVQNQGINKVRKF
ncbi:MAG: GH3 auxin-responsive promoter family protein, partial [Saprospiraceae bacterium]